MNYGKKFIYNKMLFFGNVFESLLKEHILI